MLLCNTKRKRKHNILSNPYDLVVGIEEIVNSDSSGGTPLKDEKSPFRI